MEPDRGGGLPSADAGERKRDSALHSLLPHLVKLLRREPALGITVAYLLVAMAGIFYNYRYYTKFDIPVLSLSQISDFLIAGIQQPVAPLLVLSTFAVIWVFDRINVWSRRRHLARRERLLAQDGAPSWRQRAMLAWARWNLVGHGHAVTQWAYAAIVVCYGWLFVAIYADQRVERMRADGMAQVRVRLNGSETDLAASRSPTWTYLGAVSNYVFLYDAAARQSLILPTNNVLRLEPVSAAGKSAPDPAKAGSAKPVADPRLAPSS
ncbi:hypothetical protein [Dokdonella sp.]|uniref:hypothetical protein n=1 Tax=Dokdonella sp. TaxID=2291710 RepID=UPI001B1167E1|nr:hypothetical protein [Dokdonella sp.]MBO9663064.1 hypothetical protein [Dokdonella sp.]